MNKSGPRNLCSYESFTISSGKQIQFQAQLLNIYEASAVCQVSECDDG